MVDFTVSVSHKEVKEGGKKILYRLQASWLQKAQQLSVYPPGSHKHPLELAFPPLTSIHNTKSSDLCQKDKSKKQPLWEVLNIKYPKCY